MSSLDKVVKEHFGELLKEDAFKEKLVKTLNDHIDIPFINENTEEKVLEALYKVIVSCVTNLL